ncbi:MAG TPA: hypothetical protein VEY90_03735 [Thermoleophilaceae bacterium]|nr:hypothetical protein [Thermoleophilaceae bacterium]
MEARGEMTAHEILKAAQALGEERGWHEKGVVARDGVGVCIMGASNVVATGDPRKRPRRLAPEHMKALRALAKCAGARDFTFISWWWDVASPAERERVLDRAIEVTAPAEAAGR